MFQLSNLLICFCSFYLSCLYLKNIILSKIILSRSKFYIYIYIYNLLFVLLFYKHPWTPGGMVKDHVRPLDRMSRHF